jgi:subtilisin family serine protease
MTGGRVVEAGLPDMIRLSGTSMAAGVASGMVALALEANAVGQHGGSALPPNAIKAALQYSATEIQGFDALSKGAGAINPAGAVES